VVRIAAPGAGVAARVVGFIGKRRRGFSKHGGLRKAERFRYSARVDILADLNEPQRQAVTHVDGPLLVLAGAGSGKTRVITRRVAWLMRQGIAPWNILAITFTNKAAGEMRQRVEALSCPRGATVSTFHALCARLLREFADAAGLDPNYSIYDRDDQLRIVKEAMDTVKIDASSLAPSRVHGIISNAKNELKSVERFAAESQEDSVGKRVARVYEDYERLLKKNNALDFDDLLLRVARLLRDRQEIRELLGHRYRYVLIDEYQDTNRAQYVIAHGIAVEHENICVTGDPDQSIYRWRGADIRNILEFETDYPDAVVVRLEENYRSTAPVLAAASRLIARNAQRKPKTLWTRREGGPPVRVLRCDDEHAEAAAVAEAIRRYGEGGGRYDDVAVFYRVNALSRVMEDALRKGGTAYRVARGVEFYNRKEIRDVLAYLRLLVNPSDDLSCVRVINTPARGIGAATVTRLVDEAERRGVSLLELCRAPQETCLGNAAARRAAKFAEIMAGLAATAGKPGLTVREIVAAVLEDSGLEASHDGSEENRQALMNVRELVSTAAEFDAGNEGAGLRDFLNQVALVSDVDRFEGNTGAVTLMTLHAAKGLEFRMVFMIGCEEGLLPFQRAGEVSGPGEAMQAIEEERRLAFVGMTRSMDELTMSCVKTRMIRGITAAQVVSPFLNEIGAEGVEWEDRTNEQGGGQGGRGGMHERYGFRRGGGRRRSGGGFYADSDERREIETACDAQVDAAAAPPLDEAPEYPAEYHALKVGCRVRHPQFGAGKVVALRSPWPETRAEILFDRDGHKTIHLKFVKLVVLDEWA
jgi:DNA helicase-2/ATP-dependent DNA helicase PcrA